MKIMIVEDDETMRDIYQQFLDNDYTYDFCQDAFSALNQLMKDKYDLIITDLQMPYKTGSEMIEFIRDGLDNQDLPILVISGFLDEETTRQLKTFRHVKILPKPVKKALLKESIVKIMQEFKVS